MATMDRGTYLGSVFLAGQLCHCSSRQRVIAFSGKIKPTYLSTTYGFGKLLWDR